MAYVPTYFPGVTDAASAAPVTVTAGQQLSGIDIQLRKGRVFQVSGVVGNAPSSTRVQVMLQSQRPQSGAFGFAFGQGTVKPDGSFSLPSVQPGSYDAIAMSVGAGRPEFIGRTPVTVGNSNVDNVVIQAGSPLEVTGRVVWDGEAQGQPKLTGQVMLQPAQRVPMFSQPAPIQDDGTFKISGVVRDKAFVQVFGLPPNSYVKSVMAGNVDVTESGLDLSSAETAPVLEIRVSSKSAAVEGVVRDGDKPAAGAVVMLLPQPFVAERVPMLRRSTSTDQNGRFTLSGVAPGEYRVYAWDTYPSINEMDAEQLKSFEKFAATVKLKEESREQVELKLAPLAAE
jgi:hypothetical protein